MRFAQNLRTACIAALAVAPGLARADVGNGAHVVVCGSPSSASLSVELLDYFELRQSGGTLKLNPALGGYSAMLKDLFLSWMSVAPKRIAMYERWLSDFEKESGFYSNIEITPTEDLDPAGILDGCEIVPIAYQHPDEEVFPNVKRYVISKNLWDRLTEIQKAGVVLHELIDRERVQAHQYSSFPARYFNSYLASATPQTLEYALVAQQLSLDWVEYGSGLLLDLKDKDAPPYPYGPHRFSKITQDGFVTGNAYDPTLYERPFNDYQKGSYLGFVGDVSSEHLKIHFKSFSPEATYISTKVMIIHSEVLLSDLSKTRVENFFASVDGASIELDQLPIQLLSYQMDNKKNHLEIKVTTPDAHPVELNVNPATSFYVQADGSVIASIAKLLINNSCPPQCYLSEYALYGDTLVTSSGEKWVYDSVKKMYAKQ